jgi:hypothetical protein
MRISRKQSIPEHHESVPLRVPVRSAGWSLAGMGIVGGLALAALARGVTAEVVGPLVVLFGAFVLAATWHCRRFEVTIGTARIEIGTGPFRETLATGAVESVERGRATRWRRLFADEEITLCMGVGRRREFRVPTRDPDALEAALPMSDAR